MTALRSRIGWVMAGRLIGLAAVLACSRGMADAPAGGAPEIAINVDGFGDWMSAAAYVDATAYFRRWGRAGAGWEENLALKLSADNYPLGDADAVSYLRGYPDGEYKLRYEGNGEVTMVGIAQIAPGSEKREGDVTTAIVRVRHRGADDLATLRVRNVNPAKPIRKIELLTPGYADSSNVFRSEFIRRVRPFGTIRFMDWGQTNGSPVKKWADRATPELFSRTGSKGVPIEEMVTLANVTRRNVWVNVPHQADDDYVERLAGYLREYLHGGAMIHVEYSNEVWNFGFQQAKDNLAAAKANGALTKPDDFGRCAQNAADRLGRVARVFKRAFGDAEYARRVRPVVGGFIASAYWAQTQLEFLEKHHPDLVKELAIAPYFGVEGDIKEADVPDAPPERLFAWCDRWIDTKLAEWIREHAALAQKHGMTLVAYEAGVHLTATNGMNERTKQQMQNDPRMARTLGHLLDVWRASGGGLFTQFGHIGPYSKFGYWPLLESPELAGSVKWDFYMSKLLPAGDADLDGRVGAADVAILRKNFGQSGKWWEEGDFNADGKVDAADAKLMLGNMKDAPADLVKEVEGMAK